MATLLLIDDDPDLLSDRVRHVFPAPAHRVEIAQTGAEGLKRVAATCPDVILLDLRLPDQSGLDILRQLRQIDARGPVVRLGHRGDEARGLRLPAQADRSAKTGPRDQRGAKSFSVVA